MKRLADYIGQRKELKHGITIAGITVGIYIALRWFLPVVVPFLIAFLLAGILRPCVDRLGRRRWCNEKWAAILVLITAGGLLAVVTVCVLRTLYRQVADFVVYLPFYKEQFLAGLGSCCSYIDTGFRLEEGAALAYATETLAGIFTDFQTTILPGLTSRTAVVCKQAFASVLFLLVMVYATLCMLKDYPRIWGKEGMAGGIRRGWEQIVRLLGVYLRAEGTIALLQALISGMMLWILKNPYFILLAVLIGVIDALPVLGSGTILIPWALCQLLAGNLRVGGGLLALYLLCTLNRQLLEPRLLGQKLGMSTLLTLFLMYIGYRLFGIFGFVLGPVGYLAGRELYQQLTRRTTEETAEIGENSCN